MPAPPALTGKGAEASELPGPSTLMLAPHARACMSSVTIEPISRTARFDVTPAVATASGGPPIELVLSGPGYRDSAMEAGGYSTGGYVHIDPPHKALIGSVCWVNRGRTARAPRTEDRGEI